MFETMVARLHDLRGSATVAFEQVAAQGGSADLQDLETLLVAGREAQRALQALELATLAQIGRQEEKSTPHGVEVAVRPLGHVDDHAAAAVALALGVSTASAAHRLGLGARLASRLSSVLRLVARGSIELGVAEKVERATAHLDDEACTEVETALLDRLPRLDPHRVASEARRVAQRVAPEGMADTVRRNRRECDVDVSPGPMGTAIWWAVMPSETSAAMWSSITELARRYQKDDPALTASAARAQAFADLVLRGVEVRAEVTLGMPVLGESSSIPEWARHPSPWGAPGNPRADFATACTPTTIAGVDCWVSGVDLPKVGYIPPEAVATLLSHADINVARALLESDTGVLRETCSDAYRPTPSMRKFVQTRDATCRMFGCSRPAIRCDLDHGRAWPTGVTGCTNLCGLCRRHHRTKQQHRWGFSMTRDGECTWTSPSGIRRTTHPPAMLPAHPPPAMLPAHPLPAARTQPPPRRAPHADSDPPPF
jgi:hypothetical protein